jgi:carboxymethylenebutenolidase
MNERRLDVPTPDGVMDAYLFAPRVGTGPWPLVVFYMDAFGVRPALADMADRLAANGFVVALPNLYYRSGAFEPFDPKQVAEGGAERDRFKGMIASITNTLVMRDTAALLEQLQGATELRAGAMGAVGYCMGGGFALSAAGTFPERVAAAASFHGGSLATARPDSAHLLAPRMRARVYVGVAEIDQSFDAAQRERLEAALRAAGVDHEVEVYAGAKHGFAVTGHLVYDRAASERHWERLVALLRERLTDRAA